MSIYFSIATYYYLGRSDTIDSIPGQGWRTGGYLRPGGYGLPDPERCRKNPVPAHHRPGGLVCRCFHRGLKIRLSRNNRRNNGSLIYQASVPYRL